MTGLFIGMTYVYIYMCICRHIWAIQTKSDQGFPQDKIIAGCSISIAGHMAISGLILSIF